MDDLAKEVEREKMRTIGARNLLRSVAKQRDTERKKIQVYYSQSIEKIKKIKKNCWLFFFLTFIVVN